VAPINLLIVSPIGLPNANSAVNYFTERSLLLKEVPLLKEVSHQGCSYVIKKYYVMFYILRYFKIKSSLIYLIRNLVI